MVGGAQKKLRLSVVNYTIQVLLDNDCSYTLSIVLGVGGSPLSGSPFGRPNAPILISNTQCTGTETTLNSCQYTQLSEDESNNLYANAPVAGVRCNGVPVTPSHSSSSSHKLSSSSIGLTVLSLLLVAFIALSAG